MSREAREEEYRERCEDESQQRERAFRVALIAAILTAGNLGLTASEMTDDDKLIDDALGLLQTAERKISDGRA